MKKKTQSPASKSDIKTSELSQKLQTSLTSSTIVRSYSLSSSTSYMLQLACEVTKDFQGCKGGSPRLRPDLHTLQIPVQSSFPGPPTEGSQCSRSSEALLFPFPHAFLSWEVRVVCESVSFQGDWSPSEKQRREREQGRPPTRGDMLEKPERIGSS